MPYSILQTKSSTIPTTGASSTITWANNTTPGSLIVVVTINNSVTGVSSITDSQSNTYALAIAQNLTVQRGEIWYANSIKGGTTPTITINWLGTGNPATLIIREYAGVLTTNPLDRTKSATATGTAATSGATASTLTNSYELVVSAIAGAVSSPTYTLGSGFGNLTQQNGTGVSSAIEDKLSSDISVQTGTFTIDSSQNYACLLATFKLLQNANNNYSFTSVGNGMSASEKIR